MGQLPHLLSNSWCSEESPTGYVLVTALASIISPFLSAGSPWRQLLSTATTCSPLSLCWRQFSSWWHSVCGDSSKTGEQRVLSNVAVGQLGFRWRF